MTVIKSEIRTEIINTASKIFSHNGYRKTTMNEIARSCGMGKSSLYYYYRSKEEIFEAVVVHEAQDLKKALIKVIKSGKDPMERLKGYITFRLYNQKTVKNFYSVLKEDYPDQMKFIKRIRNKFEDEEYKMVYEVLETGINEGAFQISDPRIGAIAFTTLLKGLELPLFLNKYSQKEKKKLLEELIGAVFYGIVSRKEYI